MTANPDPQSAGVTNSASSASNTAGVNVGSSKDIQGIIALGVVGGAFAIAGVAIATGTAAQAVLGNVLPLAAVVVGYYFGQKSQQ